MRIWGFKCFVFSITLMRWPSWSYWAPIFEPVLTLRNTEVAAMMITMCHVRGMTSRKRCHNQNSLLVKSMSAIWKTFLICSTIKHHWDITGLNICLIKQIKLVKTWVFWCLFLWQLRDVSKRLVRQRGCSVEFWLNLFIFKSLSFSMFSVH